MNFVDKNLFIKAVISYISNNQELINPKLFKNRKYNLIITGRPCVGKSTILQLISDIFEYYDIKINKYPEYITYNKTGQKIFEMKMNNEVSAFTFQNYILDIWETLLNKNDFKNNTGINIFERLPYDAVMCFSKKELENNKMTEEEFDMIYKRYLKIIDKFEMFDYSKTEKIKIINDDINKTISNILNIIINDIKKGIKYRCICLDVANNEIYYSRLGIRNRTAEDEYTKNVLDEFKNYYSLNF